MPILLVLIIIISVYSLTLHYEENGVVRTGLQGLKKYVIPDFSGMTLKDYATVLMDAMGQLFFSISVAMGIMVAYGSYVKKDVNLMKSINQIEIFDTVVAMLAGMMIIPAVYVFSGIEGMGKGPGLMFVSLPKVFDAMNIRDHSRCCFLPDDGFCSNNIFCVSHGSHRVQYYGPLLLVQEKKCHCNNNLWRCDPGSGMPWI